MKQFELGSGLFESMPDQPNVTYTTVEFPGTLGKVTEKEKFTAAKQILLGLAILYIFTITAYLIHPDGSSKLLDIITVTFPPIATLILAAYFRDKNH